MIAALAVFGMVMAAVLAGPSAAPPEAMTAEGTGGSGGGPAGSGDRMEWSHARPDYPWSFPADHRARPGYRHEWWYFTGHLQSADFPARRFGYQITVFRIGLLTERPALSSAWTATDLIMGHAAIGNLAAGEHRFSELLYRAVPLLGGFPAGPDPVLAWSRAPAGTDGRWELRWNGAGFDLAMQDRRRRIALELTTRPRKPLVLHGENGFSRKSDGAGAASQYYSFTRLDTQGTISIDGESFAVHGDSWMDKEFGTSHLDADQVGWDWFGLQLADGREVMLYLLRRADGGIDFGRGTLVSISGETADLNPADWRLRSTGTWKSPHTGSVYPSGWELEIPSAGLSVRIAPVMADQENVSRIVPDLHYWEGAVDLTGPAGEPAGHGYVELVGYGGSRPPLGAPGAGN